MNTPLDSASRTRAGEALEEADLGWRELVADGIVSGLVGGIALAVPLVVWDWTHQAHRALELPMAATAWVFGLEHFSNEQNLWWPIVIGAALLAVYSAVSGLAFAGLADRVFAVGDTVSSLVGGAVWGIVSFVAFWYVVLPIARNGAPFRATPAQPTLSVAPNWVWILGFTLFGLVTGAVYGALHRPHLVGRDDRSTEDEFGKKLEYAA